MRLPSKLSDLIRVALSDFEKVEKNKKYKIEMRVWHFPNRSNRGKCEVGFAGSVIAGTLKANIEEQLSLRNFREKEAYKLLALDFCGEGNIFDALFSRYNNSFPERVGFDWFDDYQQSQLKLLFMSPRKRAQWKKHMVDVSAILESEGL